MNTEGLKKLQDMFPLVDGDVVAIIFGECDEDVTTTTDKLLEISAQAQLTSKRSRDAARSSRDSKWPPLSNSSSGVKQEISRNGEETKPQTGSETGSDGAWNKIKKRNKKAKQGGGVAGEEHWNSDENNNVQGQANCPPGGEASYSPGGMVTTPYHQYQHQQHQNRQLFDNYPGHIPFPPPHPSNFELPPLSQHNSFMREPGMGMNSRHDPGAGMNSRHDPGAEMNSRHDPGAEMNSRHDPGAGVNWRREPGAGMNSRHEPGAGMNSRHEPGAGMNSRHDPGAGMNWRHEPGAGMNSRHEPGAGMNSRHELGAGMNSRHDPGAGVNWRHEPGAGMNSRHDPGAGVNWRQAGSMYGPGMRNYSGMEYGQPNMRMIGHAHHPEAESNLLGLMNMDRDQRPHPFMDGNVSHPRNNGNMPFPPHLHGGSMPHPLHAVGNNMYPRPPMSHDYIAPTTHYGYSNGHSKDNKRACHEAMSGRGMPSRSHTTGANEDEKRNVGRDSNSNPPSHSHSAGEVEEETGGGGGGGGGREKEGKRQKKLILLRGLPGSGKTTLAKSVVGASGVICSTDDYFINLNGDYVFDPSKLSEYHERNQHHAGVAMAAGRSPVIIDNTNTCAWEMKPYVSQAMEYGYSVDIMEPQTPWRFKTAELARRNHHGVSRYMLDKIFERFEHRVSVESILKTQHPSSQHPSSQHPSSHDSSRKDGNYPKDSRDPPKKDSDPSGKMAETPPRKNSDDSHKKRTNKDTKKKIVDDPPKKKLDDPPKKKPDDPPKKKIEDLMKKKSDDPQQKKKADDPSRKRNNDDDPSNDKGSKLGGRAPRLSGSLKGLNSGGQQTKNPHKGEVSKIGPPYVKEETRNGDVSCDTGQGSCDPLHELMPSSVGYKDGGFKGPPLDDKELNHADHKGLDGSDHDGAQTMADHKGLKEESKTTSVGKKGEEPGGHDLEHIGFKRKTRKKPFPFPIPPRFSTETKNVGVVSDNVPTAGDTVVMDTVAKGTASGMGEKLKGGGVERVKDETVLLARKKGVKVGAKIDDDDLAFDQWDSSEEMDSWGEEEEEKKEVKEKNKKEVKEEENKKEVKEEEKNKKEGKEEKNKKEGKEEKNKKEVKEEEKNKKEVKEEENKKEVKDARSSLVEERDSQGTAGHMTLILPPDPPQFGPVGSKLSFSSPSTSSSTPLNLSSLSWTDWKVNIPCSSSSLPYEKIWEGQLKWKSPSSLSRGGASLLLSHALEDTRSAHYLMQGTADEQKFSLTNQKLLVSELIKEHQQKCKLAENEINPFFTATTAVSTDDEPSSLLSLLKRSKVGHLGVYCPDEVIVAMFGDRQLLPSLNLNRYINPIPVPSAPQQGGMEPRHSILESRLLKVIGTSDSNLEPKSEVRTRAEEISSSSSDTISAKWDNGGGDGDSVLSSSRKGKEGGASAVVSTPSPLIEDPSILSVTSSSHGNKVVGSTSWAGDSEDPLPRSSSTDNAVSFDVFPSAFPISEKELGEPESRGPGSLLGGSGGRFLGNPVLASNDTEIWGRGIGDQNRDVFETPPHSPSTLTRKLDHELNYNKGNRDDGIHGDNNTPFNSEYLSDEGMHPKSHGASVKSHDSESQYVHDILDQDGSYFEKDEDIYISSDSDSDTPFHSKSEVDMWAWPDKTHSNNIAPTPTSSDWLSATTEDNDITLLAPDSALFPPEGMTSDKNADKTLMEGTDEGDDVKSLSNEEDILPSFGGKSLSDKSMGNDLEFLAECFPDLDRGYLQELLSNNRGNVEEAVSMALLTTHVGTPDSSPSHHENHGRATSCGFLTQVSNESCSSSSAKMSSSEGGKLLLGSHDDDTTVGDEEIARALQMKLNQGDGVTDDDVDHVTSRGDHVTSSKGVSVDGVQYLEEENLVLKLTPSMALQLQNLFGSVDPYLPLEGGIKETDYEVLLSERAAKEIYLKWVDTLKAKKIDYEVHIQLLGNTKPHTPLGEKEGVAQDSSSSDQSTNKKKRKKKKLAGGGAEPVIMATAGLRGKGRDYELSEQDVPVVPKKAPPPSVWATPLEGPTPRTSGGTMREIYQTLHQHFPDLGDVINQILLDNKFDKESTIKQLQVLQSGKPVVHSENEEGPQYKPLPHSEREWPCHKPPPARSTMGQQKRPERRNIPKKEQDFSGLSYNSLRAEAALHAKLRGESFQKAVHARSKKQYDVASYYAQQGHMYMAKMKEANERAANHILQHQNDGLTNQIDLHGLHVNEALEALREKMASTSAGTKLQVITGYGSHSKSKEARIKPAVLSLLKNSGHKYEEKNPGLLQVLVN